MGALLFLRAAEVLGAMRAVVTVRTTEVGHAEASLAGLAVDAEEGPLTLLAVRNGGEEASPGIGTRTWRAGTLHTGVVLPALVVVLTAGIGVAVTVDVNVGIGVTIAFEAVVAKARHQRASDRRDE
jgi:hypothetical protein